MQASKQAISLTQRTKTVPAIERSEARGFGGLPPWKEKGEWKGGKKESKSPPAKMIVEDRMEDVEMDMQRWRCRKN
jgi:hypothetical protein